jgi:hypothetical protein
VAERLVFYAPGELLSVFDRVERAREGAEVLSHVLWAPGVSLGARGDDALRVEAGDGSALALHRLLGGTWRTHRGEVGPRRGWASSRFGRFEPATALELAAAPLGEGWGAGWALQLAPTSLVVVGSEGTVLVAGGAKVRVAVDRLGMRWEELET